MNIVVCIKQVPDTTEVKIDQKTGTLIREGVPSIINPDDKAAIESALLLKDRYGWTVTVLSMGPPQAEIALKEAFAMGADRVILLSDRAFAGSDTWATSLVLASAIKKLNYNLIICGRQAIDGDTAQVGPQIAEHLGIPQVSYVIDIYKMTPMPHYSVEVKKIYEDFYQKIRVKLPCLLTVMREMIEPRYMTVSGIFDICQSQKVEKWSINDIDLDASQTGLKASPTQVKKTMTKGGKTAGKVHTLEPKESVKLIIDKLAEKFII